ncbi:PIG-L deacetylase family protein [Spirosoma rigui]|uniref:PIG-L deacetylase family protein n=1 Tax=Spirosoma rigui TaxID=564064 RepID=UPI0009B0A434|nr:PIG-L deacetylase family protein [Spirosoma rigui]
MRSGIDKTLALESLARAVPLDELSNFGTVLVVAPHPDDESLGCGGTIALLRERGQPVHVLFVSDGTMSHPNSPSYPASRLAEVREAEALDALRVLNVSPGQATFMRQKDSQVATPDRPDFTGAVAALQTLLDTVKPDTVLVPWRRDPHRDHRASWQQLAAALDQRTTRPRPRVLEYLIWLWELGNEADMPGTGEMTVWSVPIESVMAQRDRAIAAHRSQVTRLIDDDPTAFYLSPELLTHFDRPRELFLEQNTD